MTDLNLPILYTAYRRYSSIRTIGEMKISELQKKYAVEEPDIPKDVWVEHLLACGNNILRAFHDLKVLEYALLYVVIEGYKGYKLKDSTIDQLLTDRDKKDKLKRLRDSVFHVKPSNKVYMEKLSNFLELAESREWIDKVNKSFGTFFDSKELPTEW